MFDIQLVLWLILIAIILAVIFLFILPGMSHFAIIAALLLMIALK